MLLCPSCSQRVLPREKFCKFCGGELPLVWAQSSAPSSSGARAFSPQRLLPSAMPAAWRHGLRDARWELALDGPRRHVVQLAGGVGGLAAWSVLLDGGVRHVHRGALRAFACAFVVGRRSVRVAVRRAGDGSESEGESEGGADGGGCGGFGDGSDGGGGGGGGWRWEAVCSVDGKPASRWAPQKGASRAMRFWFPGGASAAAHRGVAAGGSGSFLLEYDAARGELLLDGAPALDQCAFAGEQGEEQGKEQELPMPTGAAAAAAVATAEVVHAFALPCAPPLAAAGAQCRLTRWRDGAEAGGLLRFDLFVNDEPVPLFDEPPHGAKAGSGRGSSLRRGGEGCAARQPRGGRGGGGPTQYGVGSAICLIA
jgi:hypothetical protein